MFLFYKSQPKVYNKLDYILFFRKKVMTETKTDTQQQQMLRGTAWMTASNIISVMMGAFALRSAGPFAAFICGLFYKNVTQRAGFISIVSGTIVAAIWIYVLHTPLGLSAMVPGGIVALIVIFVVSAIERSMGVAPAPEIELEEE